MPVILVHRPGQAQGSALDAATAAAVGSARVLEVGTLGGQDHRVLHDGAVNLRGLHHLAIMGGQGRGGHKDNGLHSAKAVAAHAPREALDNGISLGVLGALPDKGNVLLWHHLASAEAAADDDNGVDAGRIFQAWESAGPALGARDVHLSDISSEEKDAPAPPCADGLHCLLLLGNVLAMSEAHQPPGRGTHLGPPLRKDALNLTGVSRDVKGGPHQSSILVV